MQQDNGGEIPLYALPGLQDEDKGDGKMRIFCQVCQKEIKGETRGSIERKMEKFRKNTNSVMFGIICNWCQTDWRKNFYGQ